MTTTDTRTHVHETMRAGQTLLVEAFSAVEQEGAPTAGREPVAFSSQSWDRPGGGGGTARVLTDGAVFERAGVNVSAVHGEQVPPSLAKEHPAAAGQPYFATGISMVLHPRNPYAPAFHANFRYFEAGPVCWFGGGMDMTPAYGFDDDARHFHTTLRDLCARHAPLADYPRWKAWCDEYFFIKHRNEMRGIGGIFYDNLAPTGTDGFERALALAADGIRTIRDAYLPIVHRRMAQEYTDRERQWQLYRRGRYAEFNLVYDRGTVFGLQTNGYIEAILMSLPPLARWEFQYTPEPGSPEADCARFLQPVDWI
jgi:coproporphyrinogen III oxidase